MSAAQELHTSHDYVDAIEESLKKVPAETNSIAHLLPALFVIKGQPMTLRYHTPLAPLYSTQIPKQTLLMCARQVGKSESLCTTNIGMHAIKPNFQSLYVAPLFEMTRRFSANYIKPRIMDSPVKNLIQDSRCEHSVLQKTFVNGSIMHFSFAFQDCNRIRGLSVDRCNYDEVQMINFDFIPIIAETMSASHWARSYYTGTPLTTDNTIQKLWEKSSMSEWLIRCPACKEWNIPTTEFDAWNMIGDRNAVRKYGTGLKCAHCSTPIWSSVGIWVPRATDPNVLTDFHGMHIPQIILPLHSEIDTKWQDLHNKLTDPGLSKATLLNEVFGESCDTGVKLISMTHLKEASTLPWDNETVTYEDIKHRYTHTVCAVDWSGQGAEGESSTFITILGMRPTKQLEIIHMRRIEFGMERPDEILTILDLYQKFQCDWFAHDFNGAGRDVDTMVRQMLFIPPERFLPMSYVGTGASELIRMRPPIGHQRGYYQYDKTWSIMLLMGLIKAKRLVFPAWSAQQERLLEDFMNITPERRERHLGADILILSKAKGVKKHDDGVHSINFATGVIYKLEGLPDIAEKYRSRISRARMQQYNPDNISLEDFERSESGHLSDWV